MKRGSPREWKMRMFKKVNLAKQKTLKLELKNTLSKLDGVAPLVTDRANLIPL